VRAFVAQTKFKQNLQWGLAQASIGLGFGLMNLGLSVFARHSHNLYIAFNTRPFGLQIGGIWLFLAALAVSIFLVYTLYQPRYAVYSLLILVGIWSNYVEYTVFNNVADYLPFFIGVFNVADIEIWTGVVLLNIAVWSNGDKRDVLAE
jgi:lipoprotein signal peptidase